MTSFPRITPVRDHPRSRGEYTATWSTVFTRTGSSPLSRGIRIVLLPIAKAVGIIPALAGNTGQEAVEGHSHRDHPRSRGEYVDFQAETRPGHGSSPLSRGILVQRFSMGRQSRIIPALAGNTAVYVTETLSDRDHPRSRGEYSLFREHYANGGGSSPLSRGIPPSKRLRVTT